MFYKAMRSGCGNHQWCCLGNRLYIVSVYPSLEGGLACWCRATPNTNDVT